MKFGDRIRNITNNIEKQKQLEEDELKKKNKLEYNKSQKEAIIKFKKDIESTIEYAANKGIKYIYWNRDCRYLYEYVSNWCKDQGFKFEYKSFIDYNDEYTDHTDKDSIYISWEGNYK